MYTLDEKIFSQQKDINQFNIGFKFVEKIIACQHRKIFDYFITNFLAAGRLIFTTDNYHLRDRSGYIFIAREHESVVVKTLSVYSRPIVLINGGH